MTPEEIAALVATAMKPVTDQLAEFKITLGKLSTDKSAADKAAKEAADKEAADKAAKEAADKAAKDNTGKGTPEQNAEILEMKRKQAESERQIADLLKANKDATERALQAEQTTAVQTALKSFNFASPDAAQTAFEKLNAQVKRTEDGVLIAGDNLPIDAFAKDFIPTHSYLLAPETRGGSGASGAQGGQRGGKVVTLESITPTMSKEDLASAKTAVLGILGNS